MLKASFWTCAIFASVIGVGSTVSAQSDYYTPGTKPRASGGGYSDTALRSVYREGVGEGYTVESLNSIALQNARARVGNYGQASANPSYSASGVRRIPTSLSSSTSKPFSSVTSSPTVSPYLNLFRTDLDGSGDFNYQTLVRPQLQQMATNQQFERQNVALAQRVQSISAQSAFQNPAGSESQYPTGHQTTFGYYGRYYPGMPQQRRR